MSTRKRTPSKPELEAFGIEGDDVHVESSEGGEADASEGNNPGDLGDGGRRAIAGADPNSPMGVEGRPSGTRRVAGTLQRRSRGGPENLTLLSPGAHWGIGGSGPEDLARVHVREVGCFYVRPEGSGRHRCFNRLTGFEHVTYGTDEEVNECLERQSKLWHEKLLPTTRISPWRAGYNAGEKNKQAS